MTRKHLTSSFRDPAGFMVVEDGVFKRVVSQRGAPDYEAYIASGLHRELADAGRVLDHVEETVPVDEAQWARLLVPEQLRFISYPYEWTFDQLKDAALLTLEIQERAQARGLSLKDASPYNVQFRGARPVFIDTLSFERHRGGPWVAYEQFCQQFLGPLLLMHYGLPDAAKYLKTSVNGLDLHRVSGLLPRRSYLNLGALLHVHFHARSVRKRAGRRDAASGPVRAATGGLTASLRHTVECLRAPAFPAEWTNYYEQSLYYPGESQLAKRAAVRELAQQVRPSLVFDLGANTGLFARELASMGATCVAFERDSGCVNELYLRERARGGTRVLPLCMDLENPSPNLGFGLGTTLSLIDRGPADLVLCLALLHHLRFSGLLPLHRIAGFTAQLGRWLILEYVPEDDPAAVHLRGQRDGFDDYSRPGLLREFGEYYHLRGRSPVHGTARELFLFQRRDDSN